MKIDGHDEVLKTLYPDKAQKNQSEQPAEFKRILKESVEKLPNHTTKTQSADQVRPVSTIHLNPVLTQDKRILVERVDNLLNLLERFRQQLANPRVTLRTIQAVMSKITKEQDQLSAALDSLPKADGLKEILNQTLITASVEVIKFNRGDYLPS